MLIAIAVIIALPGTFPLWMKLEQAVCGLLLISSSPWSTITGCARYSAPSRDSPRLAQSIGDLGDFPADGAKASLE